LLKKIVEEEMVLKEAAEVVREIKEGTKKKEFGHNNLVEIVRENFPHIHTVSELLEVSKAVEGKINSVTIETLGMRPDDKYDIFLALLLMGKLLSLPRLSSRRVDVWIELWGGR
jgi:hypothetical protein